MASEVRDCTHYGHSLCYGVSCYKFLDWIQGTQGGPLDVFDLYKPACLEKGDRRCIRPPVRIFQGVIQSVLQHI